MKNPIDANQLAEEVIGPSNNTAVYTNDLPDNKIEIKTTKKNQPVYCKYL